MVKATGILVVEDDPATCELLSEVLAEEGYQVHACGTTAAADVLLITATPALLLLDVYLGVERSTDWLALRLAAGDRLPPVVMMSAGVIPADGAALNGVVDVLVKPFTMTDLLACVARHYPRPSPATSLRPAPTGRKQPESREGLDVRPARSTNVAQLVWYRQTTQLQRRRHRRGRPPRSWQRARWAARRRRWRRRAGGLPTCAPCPPQSTPTLRTMLEGHRAELEALIARFEAAQSAARAEQAKARELWAAAEALSRRSEQLQAALAVEVARAAALVGQARQSR